MNLPVNPEMARRLQMNSRKLTAFSLAVLISGAMAASPLVYAQQNPAGTQSATGQEAQPSNSSGSAAGQSVKNVFHEAKDKLADAALTTKVKTALLKDQGTRKLGIHVKSDRGVVTLSGSVASAQVAAQAQSIASNVKGVDSVNNNLMVSAAQ
jgi:hyperosmotically inducible periplasmic protein